MGSHKAGSSSSASLASARSLTLAPCTITPTPGPSPIALPAPHAPRQTGKTHLAGTANSWDVGVRAPWAAGRAFGGPAMASKGLTCVWADALGVTWRQRHARWGR